MFVQIAQLWDEVEERRLYYSFRTVMSGQFSGEHTSTNFWSSLVLQACHVSASIRYAVIALASLHEEFMSQHCNGNQDKTISFEHYSKALEETRNSISVKDQPIIFTIMSCVLLSCFESFRGVLANAIVHLQSGLDILLSHVTTIDSTVLSSISQIFTCIGFQANYFVDNTNHAPLVVQLQSLSVPQIGPVPTFGDIQASLYNCLNRSMFSGQKENSIVDLNSLGTHYHMTKCAQLILSGSNSPSFVRGNEIAFSALKHWQTVFDNYVKMQDEVGGDLNLRALTLLRLHHLVAIMMLNPAPDPSTKQTHTAPVVDNFKQIISWSEFLLVGKSALSAFLPDVGIIAPLFFVATKGPNSTLRHQAKSLLASEHRREGIWDSKTAIEIITEHEGLEQSNTLVETHALN